MIQHTRTHTQVKRIEAAGGTVAGGRLVVDLVSDESTGGISAVKARNVATGEEESYPADAVVSAIGVTGACALCCEGERESFAMFLTAKMGLLNQHSPPPQASKSWCPACRCWRRAPSCAQR